MTAINAVIPLGSHCRRSRPGLEASSVGVCQREVHAASGVQFTPDGKGVAYSVRNMGVDNIWIQPLNGIPGRQIRNFASDRIAEFHWSPGGKTIGVIRNHTDSDVVLLHETLTTSVGQILTQSAHPAHERHE